METNPIKKCANMNQNIKRGKKKKKIREKKLPRWLLGERYFTRKTRPYTRHTAIFTESPPKAKRVRPTN